MKKSPRFTHIRKHLEAGRFQEAISLIRRTLTAHRADPEAWVYLAQALEKTSFKDYAGLAYERAWILDPRAEWISRTPSYPPRVSVADAPSWLQELLNVPLLSLSAAIIARNEAQSLKRCLEAVQPAVDEIVVVDTGSEDQTPSIAQDLGARVYSCPWTDNFSAARNFAMEKVRTDWVFWIDADEILDPDDIHVPRVVAGLLDNCNPPVILRVVLINNTGSETHYNFDVSRLFPTRFGLRFRGRIHEQIGPPDGDLYAAAYNHPLVRIRLHHDGYHPDLIPRKLERNIRILRLAIHDNPDDVASWGFLGRELYLQGNLMEAVDVLYQAERMASNVAMYGRLPEIQAYLADALIQLGRLDEAITVSRRAVESNPQFPPGWYNYGKAQLMMAWQFSESARRALIAAREQAPLYEGIITYDPQIPRWKSLVALADVAKLQGDWMAAVRLYQQARNEQAPDQAVHVPLQHIRDQLSQLQKILGQDEKD